MSAELEGDMDCNIAVVVLDTLRMDRFRDSFDFLSGLRFTNAYATSHWTIPTHASMFTGKYPSELGVHAKSPTFDCPDSSIVEQLFEEGYTTRLWSANANLTLWDGWNRGFEELIDLARLDPGREQLVDWASFARENESSTPVKLLQATWHAITADVPTRTALKQGYEHWNRNRADGGASSIIRRLKATDLASSEFLVVNLMETHTPYHSPDDSAAVEVSIGDAFAGNVENPEHIERAYDASVEYLSEKYETLYEDLIDDFDYVLTVGDHGEMLGEDGMWNHRYGLYPELVQVPLVISGNGIDDGTHDGIVSLLDLHKTIADFADLDVDSRGRNLLNSPDERPLLTEYHGFRSSHREQFEREGAPSGTYEKHDSPPYGIVLPEGYAYQTHSDGIQVIGELAKSNVHAQLQSLRDELDVREVEEDTIEVDEATKKQLQELGYA